MPLGGFRRRWVTATRLAGHLRRVLADAAAGFGRHGLDRQPPIRWGMWNKPQKPPNEPLRPSWINVRDARQATLFAHPRLIDREPVN